TPAICFTVDCGYGPVCRAVPDEASRRERRGRLQRLVNRVVPARLAEEVTVGSGEPVEQIARAATERKADLIVVMAHDASSGDSPCLTHTVDRLLRGIRCPLLVVHAGRACRKCRACRRERT